MARESYLPFIVSELRKAKRDGRTVAELAETSGCCVDTARQHANLLRKQGRVVAEVAPPQRSTRRKGRPSLIYRLKEFSK